MLWGWMEVSTSDRCDPPTAVSRHFFLLLGVYDVTEGMTSIGSSQAKSPKGTVVLKCEELTQRV